MYGLALIILAAACLRDYAVANQEITKMKSKIAKMDTRIALLGLKELDRDCQELNVAHAVINPATGVSHSAKVTVTCDSGYAMVGNNTVTCNNGVYDNVPSCTRLLTDMKVITSSSFNIKLKDDDSTPAITGSVFLPDGQLVLCDYSNNKRIKLLSIIFTVEDSLSLQTKPWDVSVVNSTTVIVTLPFRHQLQYVHVLPGLQLSSVIQLDTDKTCCGIAVVGEEIYTSCFNYNDGEVRVLRLNGHLERRIDVIDEEGNSFMFSSPYYLTVSTSSGNIYVSDYNAAQVTCFSSDGNIIYQYKDTELNSPTGVYVDAVDNIIVCGRYSQNPQIITASGKKHSTLLTSSDGVRYPSSVAYRHSDNTLVVGSFGSENFLVVKLTN